MLARNLSEDALDMDPFKVLILFEIKTRIIFCTKERKEKKMSVDNRTDHKSPSWTNLFP